MFTIKSAEAVVIGYARRTPGQTLRLAQALRYLSDQGKSVRDLVALTAGEAAPIGRNRIALLIRTVKSCAEDVTAEDFAAALKAATDANRGERPSTEGAPASTPRAAAPEAPTVTAEARINAADLTSEQAVRLLWELVEAHQGSETFVAAVADAWAFLAPVNLGHLTATPAAA